MWKYVLLIGGLCGMIVPVFMTPGMAKNPGGMDLIIFEPAAYASNQGDNIYRYQIGQEKLHFLRQAPDSNTFDHLFTVMSNVSPDGFWVSTTFFAEPTASYVFDSISGTLVRVIRFAPEDTLVNALWSPDGRHIAYHARYPDHSDFLIFDVLNNHMERWFVPSDSTSILWRDNQFLEIHAETGRASHILDIESGDVTYEEGVVDFSGSQRPNACNNCQMLRSEYNALDVLPSADGLKTAYVRAVSNETVHIFIYDSETDEHIQVTRDVIDMDSLYVEGEVYWPLVRRWSPDENWMTLNISNDLRLLNVRTGEITHILDRWGEPMWADTKVPDVPDRKNYLSRWIVSSLAFFLIGLWRMVV